MKRKVAALLGCFLIGSCTACAPAPATGQSLCISEVQTAGGEADWVELYNYGDKPVSLQGWYLSDDPAEPGKAALPAQTLAPGEYLVLKRDTVPGGVLPFGLRAAGDRLVLSDPSFGVAQQLELPACVPGVSYGGDGAAWPPERYVFYAAPTPGAANADGMMLGEHATAVQYGVRLNEYLSRNRTVLYDTDGDYGDWVELYNFSDTDRDLSGYTLTDAEEELTRWRFPEGTVLPAGGYLVVFCSGKDKRTATGELHTNFRLGQGDSFVGLYTPEGAFCSGITCEPGEQDVSFGCADTGEVRRCRYPTPGAVNVVEEVSAP